MSDALRISDITLDRMDLRTEGWDQGQSGSDRSNRFWFCFVTLFPVWLVISSAVCCRTSNFLNKQEVQILKCVCVCVCASCGSCCRPAGDDALGSQLGQHGGHGPAQSCTASGDKGHSIVEASCRQHSTFEWSEELRLRKRTELKARGPVEP